ncbi:MAG: hypothetical protein GY822_00165 [Deltaproteobacteria bacterium]|nr:hypothetical protein [Deltaproteobacteria bacterium]
MLFLKSHFLVRFRRLIWGAKRDNEPKDLHEATRRFRKGFTSVLFIEMTHTKSILEAHQQPNKRRATFKADGQEAPFVVGDVLGR